MLPVISIVMHWQVFRYELSGIHVIRQAHTQQNIQGFYRYDANILNPTSNDLTTANERTVLRYEFPALQWGVAMVWKLTGESVLVTRVLMFLLGLLTLGGLYYWIQQLFKNKFISLACAWAFSFSPVFFYYTMNPMPDNLSLCATIWSMAFFFQFLKSGKYVHVALSALLLSIGIAAKLPYVIFLAVPGVWWLRNAIRGRLKNFGVELRVAGIFLIMLAPSILWYVWVIPTWENGVIKGILENQISTKETINILRYHAKTMFPERLLGWCAVPVILTAIFFLFKNRKWKDDRFLYMVTMALAVLFYWIFEFNMINRGHDYYMMPFLLILYVLFAYGFTRLWYLTPWTRWLGIALLAVMPFVTHDLTKKDWSIEYATYLQDVFKYQEDLKNAVPDGSTCIIIPDITRYVFSYLVDKRSFVFVNEHLPGLWVEDMITRYGTKYMYCDSRNVDINPEISQHIEKLIMERGTVRVYELKSY
jgi:hypothetical protein